MGILEDLNVEKMCKKGIELTNDIDMLLGGMEWFTKSKESKKIISNFDPELKKNIDVIINSSKKPLKLGEEFVLTVDKYLIKSQCKKVRPRKKKDGVEMIVNILNNVNNNDSYNKFCTLTNTIVELLSQLISLSKKLISMNSLRAVIVYNGGPDKLLTLDKIQKNGEHALAITKRIYKIICLDLRSAATKIK